MDEPYFDYSAKLTKHFRSLQLPVLESFSLHLEDAGGCGTVDFDAFNFYSSWRMPNVRHLETTNKIPAPACGLFYSTAIRSFSSEFELYEGMRYLQALMDFLVSLPTLVDLHLIINKYVTIAPGLRARANGDMLSKLTTLYVETSELGALSLRIQRLSMPILEKLHLSIGDLGSDLSLMECIENIPSTTSTSVKELVFAYEQTQFNTLSLDVLFERFPNIQKFDVDTPFSTSFVDWGVKHMPLLRSHLIQLGPGLCSGFLEDLVRRMQRNGRWDDSQFLQIKTDRLISWRKVEEVLAKDKSRWLA